MSKDKTLKKLTILDFMLVDLHLYLDTHPYDKNALKEYNKIVKEADMVRHEYEENFGPLCSYRSYAKDGWHWIDDPWSWDKEGNFDMDKEMF